MNKKNRYLVTVSFYLWATSHEEVIDKSKSWVNGENDLNDNNCKLVSIEKHNFSDIKTTPIIV